MKSFSIRNALFAGACTVLALGTGPAMAAESATRSVEVSYADLDLTRSEGAATLYARIQHAARLACGPAEDSRDLRRVNQHSTCVTAAVESAVRAVDRATLTALHGRRSTDSSLG
jgi:UrcA family protein